MNSFEVWERPLSNGRLALAVLNKQEIGGPRGLYIGLLPSWKICNLQCNVTQILPAYKELGIQSLHSNLLVVVNPSGTALLSITPISSDVNNHHNMHWQQIAIKDKHTIM